MSKNNKLLKVGLTGGIGCGKSTAVHLFRQSGVSVVDADVIATKLVQPGQSALEEIISSLGTQYLLEDGSLNRPLLKENIFNSPQLLHRLESILHPRIQYSIIKKMNQMDEELNISSIRYLIVDVPLLVEKKYEDLFDEIIVVDCAHSQQLERVGVRDKMSKMMINTIISQQAGRKERLEVATKTLDNSHSIEDLEKQVIALHQLFNQSRS